MKKLLFALLLLTAVIGSALAAGPGEIEIRVPTGVSVSLQKGFSGGERLTAASVTHENGVTTCTYEGQSSGIYFCSTSGSGYYSLGQPLWFGPEDAATGRVYEADPGKKASGSFQQNSRIQLYSQNTLDAHFASDPSLWPEYAHVFTSPWFTLEHGAHQQTTQNEMMTYLREKDGADDHMYLFVVGKSPVYSYEIPVVVFTETDLSSAKTLEEAAALVKTNGKATIQYEAEIHANEPAAGEGCLAMIGALDGAYGDKVLNTVNIYCIPRINPDGANKFQRFNVQDNIDMNLITSTCRAAK